MKKIFMILSLMVLMSSVVFAACPGDMVSYWKFDTSYDDDFSGTSIDTDKWTSSGTVSVDGNLDLSGNGATVNSNGIWYLKGDFDIRVDYSDLDFVDTTGSKNIHILVQSGSEYLRVDRQRIDSLDRYRRVDNTDSWRSGSVTSTSDSSGKLRITRAGSSFSAYFWNISDSSWVELAEPGVTMSNSGDVYVILKVYSDGDVISVSFDNFLINKGEPSTDSAGSNDGINYVYGTETQNNPDCDNVGHFTPSLGSTLSVVSGRMRVTSDGSGVGIYHSGSNNDAEFAVGNVMRSTVDVNMENSGLSSLSYSCWNNAVEITTRETLSAGDNEVFLTVVSAPSTANVACRIWSDAGIDLNEYISLDDWSVKNANPDLATGKLSNALDFDGSDDHVEVGEDEGLRFYSGSFSFVAWVKPSFDLDQTSQDHTILSKGQGVTGTNYFWTMDKDENKIQFAAWNGTSLDVNARGNKIQWDAEQWYYLALVYNESGYQFYVDGQDDGYIEDSDQPGSDKTPLQFYIGRIKDGRNNFSGSIDEVAVYNSALTAGEVRELYNGSEHKGLDYCNLEPTSSFTGTDLGAVADLTQVENLNLITAGTGAIVWNVDTNVVGEDLDADVVIGAGFVSVNTSSLGIFDENDGSIYTCDTSVIFFANYTNTSGDKIDGATCNITFWDDQSFIMNEGTTLYNYTYTVSAPADTYSYNVTCTKSGFSPLSAVDDVACSITGPVIPEFNFVGMLLIIIIAATGLYFVSKKK